MSVEQVNLAFENSLKNQGTYAALVHALYKLGCSDAVIKCLIVGAFGEIVKDRVDPLIMMVRAYESLTTDEQIDILYSIVDKQDSRIEDEDEEDDEPTDLMSA